MNTFTRLFAVATLLASTSTVAFAQEDAAAEQDSGANGAAENETPPEPPGVDTADDPHASADGEAEVDYEAVASSLRETSVTAADIEAADVETDIQVVRLSELMVQTAENEAAVDEALASLEDGISELRASIAANTEVTAAIGAEGYAAEDVVGVTTSQEGGLVLIVDDTE